MSVHVPTSLTEAIDLLVANPTARLLSGGTDTMVEVNFNRSKPESVIALRRIAALREYTVDSDRIVIGAGVPYAMM